MTIKNKIYFLPHTHPNDCNAYKAFQQQMWYFSSISSHKYLNKIH